MIPSTSPSSEITARASSTRPKRSSSAPNMRPSTAASGPASTTVASRDERSDGLDAGHEDGDVQEAAGPVRGEVHGEAALVLGDRRVPREAAGVDAGLLAVDAQEGAHATSLLRSAG